MFSEFDQLYEVEMDVSKSFFLLFAKFPVVDLSISLFLNGLKWAAAANVTNDAKKEITDLYKVASEFLGEEQAMALLEQSRNEIG